MIDEEEHVHDDPWQTAVRLAREKALAIAALRPEALVLGGDTVVALETEGGWEQLAKPTDSEDAVRMLGRLSGRMHRVITGVALRWPRGLSVFADESKVFFRPLEREEIEAYVATGEPLDKAGAYGCQGGARQFIERIEGSFFNVMGLPLERLEEELRQLER